MPESSMEMSNIPHMATLDAGDNRGLIVLYDIDGRAIYVSESDVEARLRQGFSRTSLDPHAVAEELPAHFRETERAWAAYVNDVTGAGHIDTSEVAQAATAHHALTLLCQLLGRLDLALAAHYPVRESEPVHLTHPATGATIQVDPGQVELYQQEPHGFVMATDSNREERSQ